MSMIVKAEGQRGRAKIGRDDPKQALSLVQYLQNIGYKAWIVDTNGNEIEEKALNVAIRSRQRMHHLPDAARRPASSVG